MTWSRTLWSLNFVQTVYTALYATILYLGHSTVVEKSHTRGVPAYKLIHCLFACWQTLQSE